MIRRIFGFWPWVGFVFGCYVGYEYWLKDLVDPVPSYVWQLAAWIWFMWSGWHLLQKLSR